jgi:heme oxygenase
MLVRLELETHVHTPSADADRLVLFDDSSVPAYRQFLSRVYGFEAPVEEALARTHGLDPQIATLHAFAGLIHADLCALGMTDPQISRLPRCAVPELKSPAPALGWLYVLERNTLLHGLIRRHLARRIPKQMESALSYLSMHEGKPGTRYRKLGTVLDAFAKHTAFVPGQIVSAAHEAFRTQRHWFASFSKKYEPLASVS